MENTEIINNENADDSIVQFITFTVNEQEYGIEITTIREIKGWIHTTTLPNTPQYMRGVINLRGSVVPILDLRCRFGLGLTAANKNNVVMIVKVSNRIMGVLVDAVSDIINVQKQDVKPIPAIDMNEHTDTVLQGIVNLEKRMIAILYLEHIFDHDFDTSNATALLNGNLAEHGHHHTSAQEIHHKKNEQHSGA